MVWVGPPSLFRLPRSGFLTFDQDAVEGGRRQAARAAVAEQVVRADRGEAAGRVAGRADPGGILGDDGVVQGRRAGRRRRGRRPSRRPRPSCQAMVCVDRRQEARVVDAAAVAALLPAMVALVTLAVPALARPPPAGGRRVAAQGGAGEGQRAAQLVPMPPPVVAAALDEMVVTAIVAAPELSSAAAVVGLGGVAREVRVATVSVPPASLSMPPPWPVATLPATSGCRRRPADRRVGEGQRAGVVDAAARAGDGHRSRRVARDGRAGEVGGAARLDRDAAARGGRRGCPRSSSRSRLSVPAAAMPPPVPAELPLIVAGDQGERARVGDAAAAVAGRVAADRRDAGEAEGAGVADAAAGARSRCCRRRSRSRGSACRWRVVDAAAGAAGRVRPRWSSRRW